MQQNYIT